MAEGFKLEGGVLEQSTGRRRGYEAAVWTGHDENGEKRVMSQ